MFSLNHFTDLYFLIFYIVFSWKYYFQTRFSFSFWGMGISDVRVTGQLMHEALHKVTDGKAAAFGGQEPLSPQGDPGKGLPPWLALRGWGSCRNLSWRETENSHHRVYGLSISLCRYSLPPLREPGDSDILLGFLNQLLKYLHIK